MKDEQAKALLVQAIKDRGTIYLEVFRELSDRFDQATAIEVMRAASGAVGRKVGQSLSHLAPDDFEGMAAIWACAPDCKLAYAADLRRLDDTGFEVKMMACPLKQSWVEAGCSEDEICTLLHCASAYDEAALETAGFDFDLELWAPGKEGCCRTVVREKR